MPPRALDARYWTGTSDSLAAAGATKRMWRKQLDWMGVSEHRWDPWTRSSKNFSVEKLRNANFNQSHQLKESHDIWEPNISLNLQPSRKIWQIWVLRLPGWNCSADLTMVGDSIDDDEPVEFDLKTTATRRWTFSSSCCNRREGKNSTVSSFKVEGMAASQRWSGLEGLSFKSLC